MQLCATTTFQPDVDNTTSVLFSDAEGREVIRVDIDFESFHAISYELLDAAGLMHQSIARVVLAASDLIDSFFSEDGPQPKHFEVEV